VVVDADRHRLVEDSVTPVTLVAAGRRVVPCESAAVRYHERVYSPLSLWVVVVAMTGSLAVAYGHVLGVTWGLVTFVVAQGLATWWLLAIAPVISVDADALNVGPASLPLRFIGEVGSLDHEQTKAARGTRADPHAHLRLRPGVPTAVVVEVTDPDDPHPYWLISSRRPDALKAAIGAVPPVPRSS